MHLLWGLQQIYYTYFEHMYLKTEETEVLVLAKSLVQWKLADLAKVLSFCCALETYICIS